jgi:hypothetical protein
MKIAMVFLTLLAAATALAADVTGKWNATAQSPDGGEMQIVFNLKQDGDKLTGNVESPMGTVPITEGKMDGDAIAFTVEMGDMKIVHKGTVTGDEMKIKVEIGDQVMNMVAKRAK